MHLGCGNCRRVACVDTEPVRRCVGEQQREQTAIPAEASQNALQQGYDHVLAKQGSRCSQPPASGCSSKHRPTQNRRPYLMPDSGRRSMFVPR
jgi:hypothetical protein